jgi:hypothetical protein
MWIEAFIPWKYDGKKVGLLINLVRGPAPVACCTDEVEGGADADGGEREGELWGVEQASAVGVEGKEDLLRPL